MRFEDYFEFEKCDTKFGPVDRIRIKGHRLAIENIIEPFNTGVPPETIVRKYHPTLSLEQVYATIAYYLHNQKEVDEYIRRRDEIGDRYYQEHSQQEPSPMAKRIRALKAKKRGD
jgi:uncharacterized protein (DUF433 family)